MNNSSIKQSKKIAVGGIFASLSLMIMLLSWISILAYIVPVIAGLVLIIVAEEIGVKWAMLSFIGVSILSLILADKEAAMMYIAFFGYYPIIKNIYDKKIANKLLRYFVKLLHFAVSITISFIITTFIFAVPLNENGAVTAIYILFFALALIGLFIFDEIATNEFTVLFKARFKRSFDNILKK